jgi:hypothetical protein
VMRCSPVHALRCVFAPVLVLRRNTHRLRIDIRLAQTWLQKLNPLAGGVGCEKFVSLSNRTRDMR